MTQSGRTHAHVEEALDVLGSADDLIEAGAPKWAPATRLYS